MEAAVLDESPALYAKYRLPSERSIRVLDIKPNSDFEQPVEASMGVIDLPELPDPRKFYSRLRGEFAGFLERFPTQKYQALSYAWGSPTQTTNIYVDDLPVAVTPHLEMGLKRIRENHCSPNGTFSTRIWADAICINQRDDNEKLQQVMMMGDVYTLAKRLIIWLGECTTSDLIALRGSDCEQRVAALEHICKNPYFRRRWVIQEVYLSQRQSRHVLYDSWRIRFETLMKALSHNLSPEVYQAAPLLKLKDSQNDLLYQSMEKREMWQPICMSLLIYRHTECLVTHDRFFALLCLTKPGMWNGQRSYSDDFAMLSITYAKREMIETTFAKIVLICATITASGTGSIPSWVPDWSRLRVPVSTDHAEVIQMIESLEAYIHFKKRPDGPRLVFSLPEPDGSNGLNLLSVRGWVFKPCGQNHSEQEGCLSCRTWCLRDPEMNAKVRQEFGNLVLAGNEYVLYMLRSACLFIVAKVPDGRDAYVLQYCFHAAAAALRASTKWKPAADEPRFELKPDMRGIPPPVDIHLI